MFDKSQTELIHSMSIRVWTWDAASSRTLEHGTTRAMTPPPASRRHYELLLPAVRTSTPGSAVTISASDQVTVCASRLADGHPLACPPPVVSQRYQDIIHSPFILGGDYKHTVRGCGRVCGHRHALSWVAAHWLV